MARQTSERDISPILAAGKQWISTCLVEDRSILSQASLWARPLVEELREAYVEHPDLGQDDFITKLKSQVGSVSSPAKQLMAEMLWALLLFPSNIGTETKRQQVTTIWGLSGQQLGVGQPFLKDEVLVGIGSGGIGFNNHRWREMVFLIVLTGSLKQKGEVERRQVFSNYEAFLEWMATVVQDGQRQFRHMLRFFAFPDRVERMSSNGDRRTILDAYGVASQKETKKWTDRQLDDALLRLRTELQGKDPSAVLDFYESPLKERWKPEETRVRVWIEKTIVSGRPDRDAGDYALGKMLWSPKQSKNGGDIYRFMREVQPGDQVLHLTDNEGFTGTSVADSAAEEFNGLPGTAWSDRPSYRIKLRDFSTLEPPLLRETFFSQPYRDRLVKLIDAGQQNLFFNSGPALNQGAYLTPASPELLSILNEAYESVSGKQLIPGTKGKGHVKADLSQIAATFAESLRDAHLAFGPGHVELVRAFLASLATKGFVILTGLSGSGKSQIALKFGQWLGTDAYKLIPVRPDWTGPDALFGYEDALSSAKEGRRGWHVPDALAFILKASGDPENPYALILDEMNLAHVERYFADALSGMESRERFLPNLTLEADAVWRLKPLGPRLLAFPRNLFVLGTVNVDETTYLFSPKVLDRANTFEFRVDTAALSSEARRPSDLAPGDSRLARGLLSVASSDDWHLRNPAPWLSDYNARLRSLHQLLAESSLEFGHRVYYEAVRFAAFHVAAGEPALESALDRQVLQKILPRIHGARKRVEAVLCSLGQFCLNLTYEPGSAHPGAALKFDPLKPELTPAVLPLSFDKIRRMVRTLRANQFTSFTD